MTVEFIFDCLLVVAMIHLASKAPVLERRQTVFVAALLTVDWLLFNLAWVAPLAPAHLLKIAGLPVTHSDVWMVTDAMVGATILAVAGEHRWADLLWGLLACQVVATYMAPEPPLRILDILFYCQITVFFFFRGGEAGRVRHNLSDLIASSRVFSRALARSGTR